MTTKTTIDLMNLLRDRSERDADFLRARTIKFTLPGRLVKKAPASILRLMSHCAVFRCEYLYITDEIEYTAYYAGADECNSLLGPPEYRLAFEATVEDSGIDVLLWLAPASAQTAEEIAKYHPSVNPNMKLRQQEDSR